MNSREVLLNNMFRFNLWARPFMPPSAQGLEGGPIFPGPMSFPHGVTLGGSDVNKNGLQIHDKEKDSAAYSTAAFPFFRPGDGLPHALYSPLHQHFLRAQIELANAHSRDATTEAMHHQHGLNQSSAFAPAKRQRTDETSPRSLGSPGIVGRRDAVSPRSVGSSGHPAPVHDLACSPTSVSSRVSSPKDDRDTFTPSDDGLSRSSPHDGVRCPICRVSLPATEMTSHLAKEIQELHRIDGSRGLSLCEEKRQNLKSRYETFLRIRGNREGRLGESRIRGMRRKRTHDDDSFMSSSLDDSLKREEEEQIDVLSCDDPDTRMQQAESSQSPDSTDRPHDLSRKTLSPPVQDGCQSRDALCCTGCGVSFTKVAPVTSTKCWHVHCDACWKKQSQPIEKCPQCSIQMTSEDLRRIYL